MKSLIQSKNTYLILVTELIIFLFIFASFKSNASENHLRNLSYNELFPKLQDTLKIVPAADLTHLYLPFLKGKKIALVANQTSVVQSEGSGISKTGNIFS